MLHRNSLILEIKWEQIQLKTWGRPIWNCPCTLGRPIGNRPCNLGKPIWRPMRIRLWILRRPIWIPPCILKGQYGTCAPSFTPNFTHKFTSKFTLVFIPSLNPNITTNLLHHHKCNVICLSGNRKLSPLYSPCFLHSSLFPCKVASIQSPAKRTCRKRL